LSWQWKAVPGRRVLRRYTIGNAYAGAWRTFAECLLPGVDEAMLDGVSAFDTGRLLAFVRRYGPLQVFPGPTAWFGNTVLACRLRELAENWTVDPAHSVFQPGPAYTTTALHVLGAGGVEDDLGNYLARSAHWCTGRVMARCQWCGHWMVPVRATRKFCNAGCRNHLYKEE
jgi:hypothetical protein